ncbi:Exonuclease 3'-5' domain-like-containing protein 1 [Camponotus floridanus]|uniref:Exonuclease 3'-5' domain-like-containing protein 1 n=2 Tax=Camponotus floridanus TaxID=104421 RepID=E2ARE6_CAMFO|nr:Exonuclease 3'-5' domain-like-containing protein 1 [Camponotus floridanus]
MKPEPFHELEPDIPIDPDVTAKLLDFFCVCIERKGPIVIDQLFNMVNEKFSHENWTSIFNTPQDLSTFIKMFPDAFHVQTNLVTLIGRPKSFMTEPVAAKTKVTSGNQRNSVIHTNNAVPVVSPSKIQFSQPSLNQSENVCNNVTLQSNSVQNTCTSPVESNNNNSPPVSLQQQSLKQRFNTIVMRTLADNTERDRSLQTAQMGDAWKLKVLQQTRVIATTRESLQVIEDIINPRKPPPDGKVVVSFDCEGINLGVKGQLTLVQIGTMSGQAYMFDLFTCPRLVQDGGLQKLLEHPHVIKVIHDCRNDSVNLYNQFTITLMNVFDTQAAHAVLQFQETGKPVYKVKNVNLNTLCDHYGAPCNPLKEQLKNIYRKDQRYWSRRPMTRDMLIYASSDVLSLVPQVYNAMSRLIKPEVQGLFAELCEEQIQMHIRPADVKARKRQRKMETEMVDLKKRMEEATSKNIVLSNREIRLLRWMDLTEDEKEKLKANHKVARKLEKLENMGQDKGDSSDDDDEDKTDDPEYQSLESYTSENSHSGGILSPRNADTPSLTESMQMVDEILSDGRMDKLEKIEKLEAILSAVTSCATDQLSANSADASPTKCVCLCQSDRQVARSSVACQTLSTGDIVITRIFVSEEEKERVRLQNSPKK